MKDEVKPKDPVEPVEPVVPAEPSSLIEEAKAIRDEIVKTKDELKAENDRKEKLQAEELLSPTSGGHIKAQKVDPAKQKSNDAAEYFKGTQLEKDIKKANE